MYYDTAIEQHWTFKTRPNSKPMHWAKQIIQEKGNTNCPDFACFFSKESYKMGKKSTIFKVGTTQAKGKDSTHILPIYFDGKKWIVQNFMGDLFTERYECEETDLHDACKEYLKHFYKKWLEISKADPGKPILEVAEPEQFERAMKECDNTGITQAELLSKIFSKENFSYLIKRLRRITNC